MSRAIDLIITYRVVKMLVTPFKKFKAFELGIIDETTKMSPVSPYACSKLGAHTICANYRNAYNLFISWEY